MPGRLFVLAAVLAALHLAGCAAPRPANPRLEHADPEAGYRWSARAPRPDSDPGTLFILAFSGGGMRAAAFSYGVVEELGRTPVGPPGGGRRMLDEVDLISGVSGGSFTALSYALHGERLFDEYERRFLKRDVEGELIGRVFNPLNLAIGRSEIATGLYDELLFDGATFADLVHKPTPTAIVGSTAISLGMRLAFSQRDFDVICSDLAGVRLAEAATASSAVPVVFAPVTLGNYGGTCGYRDAPWIRAALAATPRDSFGNRVTRRYESLVRLADGAARPYIHLVDGGLSGNLGVYAMVEELQELEASAAFRAADGFDRLRRIAIVVVNAHSAPELGWDKDPFPPPAIALLLQSVSVPIDRDSYEAVYALEDMVGEWRLRREAARAGRPGLPPLEFVLVNVSFDALADAAEREYLLGLPTTLTLSPEAVDRLRAAAAKLLRESAAFRGLVGSLGPDVAPPRP